MHRENGWEKSAWHNSCEQQACVACCVFAGMGHYCYATVGTAAKAAGLIPANSLGVCELHPVAGVTCAVCCMIAAASQSSVQFGRDEMHSCIYGSLYNGIKQCTQKFQKAPAVVLMSKKAE